MSSKSGELWRVIYVTPNQALLDAVEQLLTDEGFLVRRSELQRSASGACDFGLQVLKSEAAEARQLIMEKGF